MIFVFSFSFNALVWVRNVSQADCIQTSLDLLSLILERQQSLLDYANKRNMTRVPEQLEKLLTQRSKALMSIGILVNVYNVGSTLYYNLFQLSLSPPFFFGLVYSDLSWPSAPFVCSRLCLSALSSSAEKATT